MNQYGLPLTTPSVQTILPAIIQSGIVVGWYPIASHSFAGTETSFTLSDGTVVPITTVTKDNGMEGVQQYMAAVFPLGIANNYAPWASSLLIKPDAGYYRWWSLPTETWMLHFGYGTLLESLHTRLNISNAQPAAPGAPTVTTPAAITWQASIAFADLTGDCEFFDFNWITTFRASTTGVDPLRVVVVSNPAGHGSRPDLRHDPDPASGRVVCRHLRLHVQRDRYRGSNYGSDLQPHGPVTSPPARSLSVLSKGLDDSRCRGPLSFPARFHGPKTVNMGCQLSHEPCLLATQSQV